MLSGTAKCRIIFYAFCTTVNKKFHTHIPIYMSVEKMVEPRRGVIVVDVCHMINAQKLSYVRIMVQKENLHLHR